MTNTSPEDPEQARSLIAQTLVQFTAVVARGSSQDGGQGASIAMALVVPTLLSRAATEGAKDDVYRETSARLLELASADQTAFRAVVGAMSEGQRAFMEEVIKSGRSGGMTGGGAHVGAGGRRSGEDEEQAPTIALKMNFGG